MSNGYFYKKAIIRDLESNPTFVKISINNNIISCSNKDILKDIENKIKTLKIIVAIFYTSLYDYELIEEDAYYETIKNLPLSEMPIYKKNTDIQTYLNWLATNFNNNKTDIYETSKFTKREKSFSLTDVEKCKKSVVYDRTNHKFNTFNQLFYHAGDHEDLERYGLLYARTFDFRKTSPEFDNVENPILITMENITNTLNYLFDYMKHGIIVGIKSNKLAIFLPFSNYNYKNDFYEELYFNDYDKELLKRYSALKKEIEKNTKNRIQQHKRTNSSNHANDKQSNELTIIKRKLENAVRQFYQTNHLNTNDVNLDREEWVGNGCLFENKLYSSDKSETLYEDFFTTLCQERILPDCIFFINLRDHPVVKKDYMHPYDIIIHKPIPDRFLKNFAPIFSQGCSIEHMDIPMVTQDDWMRISQKIFPDDCKNSYLTGNDNIELSWDKKKPIAIFRGSATGCGLSINDNMRIKASYLSLKNPLLLDAGLTSFNRKIEKSFGKPLIVANTNDLKRFRKEPITNSQKSQFKYILTIDGHSSCFQLGYEFSMKSVLLLPESKFYLWFSDKLKPYVHYVPVNANLSNLIEIIIWCKANDEQCKVIAENGYDFYKKYLCRDGALDYMQKIMERFCYVQTNSPLTSNILSPTISVAKNIAIICPYRNNPNNQRLQQKRLFTYFMTKILQNNGFNSNGSHDNVSFTIVIVEQNKDTIFNIGKLKNVGYLHLKNLGLTFDNYIFSDIDTLPDEQLTKYYFKITNGVTALATKGTRYDILYVNNPDNNVFLGAAICLTGQTFEKINGYSLLFNRGWGGEDDNLIGRCFQNDVTVFIPKNGRIIDIEEENEKPKALRHKIDQLKREGNYDNQKWEALSSFHLNNVEGLKNTNFHLLNEFNYNFDDNNNVIHIIVNLGEDVNDLGEFDKEKYDEFNRMKKSVKRQIF